MFDFNFMRDRQLDDANELVKHRRHWMRKVHACTYSFLEQVEFVGIFLDDIVEGCCESICSQKVSVTQKVEGNVR